MTPTDDKVPTLPALGAERGADTLVLLATPAAEEVAMSRSPWPTPQAGAAPKTEAKAKKGGKRRRTAELYSNDSLALLTESGDVVQAFPAAVTDSLRYMVARMRSSESGVFPARLGLTSAISGEGVSFLSRALALVLADGARRVCLVDLNWWVPTQWPAVANLADGIAQVLLGWVPLDVALAPTGNPGLSILPAGATSANERMLLASSSDLAKLLAQLARNFDHVVLDLPAVLARSEAITLAEQIGGVALVVREGVTADDQVKQAMEELGTIPVLGAILNRHSTSVPKMLRRFAGA